MLKRLLIAVFVVGLLLALNGTALSDVNLKSEANPVIKINPDAPLFNAVLDARPHQPAFKKPESALKELPPGLTLPSPPQYYFCDIQDYTSGSTAFGWPIPDAYGDDLFNMRFTSENNFDCTLKVAYYLMYGGTYVSGNHGMTGDPDFRAYLWDDDGFGFPGNKLDSVDIPWATIQAEWTAQGNVFWLTADFSAAEWVFSDGEEYHYGWTTLQNTPDDTLSLLSDAADGPFAGEERASEYWGGLWGTMLNDWGLDVSFFIFSERCCSEQPYSDCYWKYYYQNISSYVNAPYPGYNIGPYCQRYSVAGPETLQFVQVGLYDPGDGSFGNDDVIITVFDDTSGFPATQLAQVTVPAGTYPSYPSFTLADFSSFNMVFTSDFHIGVNSSGTVDYENLLGSDGSDGLGRSTCFYPAMGWTTMLYLFGTDMNFVIRAYMCKDEFYDCAWQWHNNGIAWYWKVPDTNPITGWAQKMQTVGENCRIQEVSWYLYDNGSPNAYTYNSDVLVYADVGGLPGGLLGTITLTPGMYNFFPAPTTVDFEPLDVYSAQDYWVAIESYAPDTATGIRILVDDYDVGGGGLSDGLAIYYAPISSWLMGWSAFGMAAHDWAAYVEAYQCCIPFSGRTCIPSGEDWATYQHDFARTGASNNGVGDAWCDLTCNWGYEDPVTGISFAGPIIAYDKVVCSFTDHYIVFDLATGAQVYTLTNPFPSPPFWGNIRCTPTVGIVGTDTLLFVSGGTSQSIEAYNFSNGAPVWSRDMTTTPTELYGLTRWARPILLEVASQVNLYWGTDDGYVVGANAATGTLLPGYPVPLTLSTYVSGATDGTNLYFATWGTGVEGDVYSLDAATGVENWRLSTAPGGELQGQYIWTHANGYFGDEGFTAGVSYDKGTLFANSRAEADHPTDGLFYRINANTGAVQSAVLGNRAYYQTPIVDVNHVYMPTLTRWASPPAGGNMYKVARLNGNIVATFTSASGGRYYCDGILTCEPEESDYPDDLIYAFNEDGYLSCVNSITFEEVYRRRLEHSYGYPYNMGVGGAMGPDATGAIHVTFGSYWGDLCDYTKQTDRPRLEIQTYNPTMAVVFGTAASLKDTIYDVFVNTGCVDLNFLAVTVDEIPSGQTIPDFASATTVDPTFMDRAAKIADKLAQDAFLSKYLRVNEKTLDEDNILTAREKALNKESINRAAAGFPPFLNAVDFPTVGSVIAAGDTADLALDIIQTAISRGPQPFYILMQTDDPDFFMCCSDAPVEIRVTLVGGCLIDTTTLTFGASCANEQLVTNTGRLGTGDWGDGPAGYNAFLIDGDGASYYQGSYVYAVSTYRIATHSQDWISGGGEADAYVSLQPDPNWCDDDCKPYLNVGVSLGEYSPDGNSYTTLTGDMVCKSFLDSVQNFDLGGGWDWANFGAPFDNDSTMGLYVKGRVVGICDMPELANVTLEILEFVERNGDSVKNWYLGEYYDCDNGGDEVAIDRSISTAWSYDAAATQAWGQIKVPFGCGYEPLINTWGESGVSGDPGHGFWGWGIWWDSCYNFMTRGPGSFSDGDIHAGDEEALVTLASNDFGPNDTLIMGIAHFGLHGLTDAADPGEYASLAKLVNKWAGFGRGDVDNDGAITLADIIYLAATVNNGTPGAVPFKHLSDVNADGSIDMADVNYLIDYYFWCSVCPKGAWIF